MESFILDPTTVATAHLQAFILVLIRVSGIFERLPIFGGATIPRKIKVLLSLAVTIVIFPVAISKMPTPIMSQSIAEFLVAAAAELSLGLLIGFTGSLLLTGLQLGGKLVDDEMGFSLANVLDPMTNESVSITSQLVFFLGTLLFVVMGGVNLIIEVLAYSFEAVPLVRFTWDDRIAHWLLIDLMPQTFLLGVVFAAPTIVVVVMATVALGLIGKVVPEMNIFSFSFGVRAMLGLIMLTLSVRYMPGLMANVIDGTRFHLEQMLQLASLSSAPATG